MFWWGFLVIVSIDLRVRFRGRFLVWVFGVGVFVRFEVYLIVIRYGVRKWGIMFEYF